MNTTETKTTEEMLQQIKEKLSKGEKPELNEFKEVYKELNKQLKELQELLEWAWNQNRNNEFTRLLNQIKGYNVSELMDKLRNKGYYTRKDTRKELKESFERMGYRLMEQVRVGKREEAYYTIARIYIAANQNIPREVVEPFKPIYSDSEFKVMLFAFISGILGSGDEEIESKPENNNDEN